MGRGPRSEQSQGTTVARKIATRTSVVTSAATPSGPSLRQALNSLRRWADLQTSPNSVEREELYGIVNAVVPVMHNAAQDWNIKQANRKANYNPLRDALVPGMSKMASQSRSFDASHGIWLEEVSAAIVRHKFGGGESKTFTGFATRRPRSAHKVTTKTVDIWSSADPDLVKNEAKKLLAYIEKGHKIGSQEFAKKYQQAVGKVNAGGRVNPWLSHADMGITDDGFFQIKAGGNLDESKAPAEVSKLMEACLAYGDERMLPRFGLCYANRGEGKAPDGSLPKYFNWSPSDKNSPMLVGAQFWEHILPKSVSYPLFLQMYNKIGSTIPFNH